MPTKAAELAINLLWRGVVLSSQATSLCCHLANSVGMQSVLLKMITMFQPVLMNFDTICRHFIL